MVANCQELIIHVFGKAILLAEISSSRYPTSPHQADSMAKFSLQEAPNEIRDLIFVHLHPRDSLSLSVTSQSLHGSATKTLYAKSVTLVASTNGDIRKFCTFLKNVITHPTLGYQVEKLSVSFHSFSSMKREK